jgi:segregation and condensation protein A
VPTQTAPAASAFAVRLTNFEGPFDLLLSLIAKHKLDICEVALAEVTDEFMAFIRQQGSDWDVDQASHFLVVAATLVDLKTARLLPQGEVDDSEDIAILEARDLLFARLLQYQAFKQVAGWIKQTLVAQSHRVPRPGGLDQEFAGLVPDVVLGLTGDDLARLAAQAMRPVDQMTVSLEHLHAPAVSVAEQAHLIGAQLRRAGSMSFRALIADAESTLQVVARFLALLEMYRASQVTFTQLEPNSELIVRWVADDTAEITITDDYDGSLQEDA